MYNHNLRAVTGGIPLIVVCILPYVPIEPVYVNMHSFMVVTSNGKLGFCLDIECPLKRAALWCMWKHSTYVYAGIIDVHRNYHKYTS